jgi:MraZ protein
MAGPTRLGFLGTSTHAVDKKNRVFLAKRFQDALPRDEAGNRTAVLFAAPGGCLVLTTPEQFDVLAKPFEQNPLEPGSNVDDQRDFFEYVAEVTLDTSGRLLLPQDLKDLCGISENVVMVGARNRVELWSAERWEARKRGTYSPRPTSAPREGQD